MRGEDFCPLCGKIEGRFIKGLCEDCFLKKHPLVNIPETVEFEQCSTCEKIKISGKLIPFNEDSLKNLVERKVKSKDLKDSTVTVKISEDEEGFLFAHVLVKGIFDDVPLLFEKDVMLETKLMQCDPCMRLASLYHEAIIHDSKIVKPAGAS